MQIKINREVLNFFDENKLITIFYDKFSVNSLHQIFYSVTAVVQVKIKILLK